jgi:maltodextrin utilization protein YvdJ
MHMHYPKYSALFSPSLTVCLATLLLERTMDFFFWLLLRETMHARIRLYKEHYRVIFTCLSIIWTYVKSIQWPLEQGEAGFF